MPTSGQARTSSALPATCSSRSSPNVARPRVRRHVVSPTRTLPDAAARSSRAARFTASPTTSASSALTTTSPVLTPTRSAIDAPDSRCDVVRQRFERVVHRERSVERAQCVVLVRLGDAEHGHRAVADELHDATAHAPRRRRESPRSSAASPTRTDSGSMRSWSAVEPARSAKTIVTTLRPSAACRGEEDDCRRIGRRAALVAEPSTGLELVAARSAGRRERCAARRAEPRALPVRLPADRAGEHPPTPRGRHAATLPIRPERCVFADVVVVVGLRGFEPRTSSLSGMRSNQLSYSPLPSGASYQRGRCRPRANQRPLSSSTTVITTPPMISAKRL